MIRHIVVWKLLAADEAQKSADRATIIEALEALPLAIQEIRALYVRPNSVDVPSNWELVLVVDFDSPSDLQSYRKHPAHQRVVQIVHPRVSQRAVIDFEI